MNPSEYLYNDKVREMQPFSLTFDFATVRDLNPSHYLFFSKVE